MDGRHINISFTPKTILWVIVTAMAVWLTFAIKDVIIVLLLSFIFASAIDPTIDALEKKKVPRIVAIAILYLLIVTAVVLALRVLIPPAISQISSLSANKEVYIEKISSYFHTLSPELRENIKKSTLESFSSIGKTAAGGLLSGAYTVLSGLLGFVLMLVIAFYLLLQKDGPEKFISQYIPKDYSPKAITVARKITAKMGAWFRGQLLLGFIIFLISFVGLSVLKVDYALTLAILAGFMELIPVIGPFISGAAATIVALTSSPILGLIVAVFYLLVQQLENNILVPQIMKKTLGLNPVVVIVSLLIGAKVLGVLGALVAVPVAAAISVIMIEFYKNKGGN